MAKDLVIVESPAKARTIGRFLGKKYEARASMGHVRDLPRRSMGVKVDDMSFKPTYSVPPDKRKIVSELAKLSKNADVVYLATDPDREGEAISWHLIKAAKIDESKVKRVVFHEITQRAVEEAFQNPRDLDLHLVDAQQARRILDRLVGYDLSPVLWKKVRRGLSAGRVQSVALRLMVEREKEIDAFVANEYWSITATLAKMTGDAKESIFEAEVRSVEGRSGRLKIPNGDEAQRILSDLDSAVYRVGSVRKKETRNRPAPPFITSTLQQEAWRKLRFSARRTMAVAQQLYEGMELGEQGSTGLITYMRTDSTNVSTNAVQETREYVNRKFGAEYVPNSPKRYTKKVRGAQEAHEAIRPASISLEPDAVRKHLNRDQARLYQLVWKRMVASQMEDALLDSTTVDVESSSVKSDTKYTFRATGSVLKFPGFRVLYIEDKDEPVKEKSSGSSHLPALEDGEAIQCLSLTPEQKFTEPPPRYTEATLVRALEEQGIGRPSTYAPTIATVIERDYVRKEGGRMIPTKLGVAVTELLTSHFPDIMNVGFTARVEEELDDIASGEREWTPVLKEFYGPFHESVTEAIEKAERVPRDQIDEESDEICEVCERNMVIKMGRFGRFLSCSGFPECRNSRPLLTKVGVSCPECENDLVERKGRGKGGKRFYGCSDYPNCTFSVPQKPLPQPCPECGGLLTAYRRDNSKCTSCDYRGPVPEEDDTVGLAS